MHSGLDGPPARLKRNASASANLNNLAMSTAGNSGNVYFSLFVKIWLLNY